MRPEGDHSDAGPLSHWCKLKLFMGVDHQAHAKAGQWSVNTFQESYRGHVTISVIEKSTDTGSWLGRIVYVQYKLTQRTESGLPSTGSCSIFYSPADSTVVTCNVARIQAAEIEWEIRLVLSFLLYFNLRSCSGDHKNSSCCQQLIHLRTSGCVTGLRKGEVRR